MLSLNPGRTMFRFLSVSAVLALLVLCPTPALAAGRTGAVYVLSNQQTGNSILAYHRNANGSLTFIDSIPSGGIGAGTGGDPLASQGAVVLSGDNRLLFAVNAGSDSISVFAVSGDDVSLLDTVPSGGSFPVSLTVRDNLLYVVNAGGTPNVSGFRIETPTNTLTPLADATQDLPGGATAAPGEVSFTPDGDFLVVTEKGTNQIDTFPLDSEGVAGPGTSFASGGATPFGFTFGHNDVLVVSDAGNGPGTAALSSYGVSKEGDLSVITPALGDTQSAACWVVVPQNGKFAFTSNAGSGTISSYEIAQDGSLQLLDIAAASFPAGSAPTDMALSNNGQFLYVRNGGNGTVSGFRIGADGSLSPAGFAAGLPDGTQGIAAR